MQFHVAVLDRECVCAFPLNRSDLQLRGAVFIHETVNGFVRVFAKNRDIPGNSEVCNLLRTQ